MLDGGTRGDAEGGLYYARGHVGPSGYCYFLPVVGFGLKMLFYSSGSEWGRDVVSAETQRPKKPNKKSTKAIRRHCLQWRLKHATTGGFWASCTLVCLIALIFPFNWIIHSIYVASLLLYPVIFAVQVGSPQLPGCPDSAELNPATGYIRLSTACCCCCCCWRN